MEIKVLIDYGADYHVYLTPSDARKLYDQLRVMFEISPFKPLDGNGYEVEVKDSPTESTGTLRESQPNGICNDPTIPVENW